MCSVILFLYTTKKSNYKANKTKSWFNLVGKLCVTKCCLLLYSPFPLATIFDSIKFFHNWQGYLIEEESEGCIDGQQEASRVDPRQYFRCIRGDWVILFCDEGWTYNDLYKSCQVSKDPGSCASICLAIQTCLNLSDKIN